MTPILHFADPRRGVVGMSSDRESVWRPGKLLGLAEVVKNFPFERFQQAQMRAVSFSTARNDEGVKRASEANAAIRRDVLLFLDDVEQCCAAAELVETPLLVRDLRGDMQQQHPRSPLEVFTITSVIADLMISELNKRRFFFLEAFEASAFEHPHYLGEDVWEAFPSARLDVSEMGSCLACGRYNAAAYHAVQAAEIGVRELARDRRAKPISYRKPTPLDQAQWGELLKAIKDETDKIRNWPKGAAKDGAHQFYEPALLEANALNDGWRRHLSHARTHEFQLDEVQGLIGHVRRFLGRLAERIGEDRRPTPAIWRSPNVGLKKPLRIIPNPADDAQGPAGFGI